jgi:hypothetical protein
VDDQVSLTMDCSTPVDHTGRWRDSDSAIRLPAQFCIIMAHWIPFTTAAGQVPMSKVSLKNVWAMAFAVLGGLWLRLLSAVVLGCAGAPCCRWPGVHDRAG